MFWLRKVSSAELGRYKDRWKSFLQAFRSSRNPPDFFFILLVFLIRQELHKKYSFLACTLYCFFVPVDVFMFIFSPGLQQTPVPGTSVPKKHWQPMNNQGKSKKTKRKHNQETNGKKVKNKQQTRGKHIREHP